MLLSKKELKVKFENSMQWLQWFFVGLWDETKEVWKDHSAVLFWWTVVAFLVGLIV